MKSAPSSGRSTPTSLRSGKGSKPGTPREGTPELNTRSSKRTSLNTSPDSPTSKKTTGRRSKETSRRSVETSRRSVEKAKERQSIERTSGRRSAAKRGRSAETSEDEAGNYSIYV